MTASASVQERNVPRTVLIADDNRLIRDALCKIFEVEHDYELCAQATNGEEAVALAIEHHWRETASRAAVSASVPSPD